MRKRELLKRIEELEKTVAALQQQVSDIEKKRVWPLWVYDPWAKEYPPQREYIFTCAGDSTSGYTV